MNEARHELWIEKVNARLDGELPDAEWGAVDGHIASCSSCRGLYEEWTDLRHLLRRGAVSSSEPFVTRVMAEVESRERAASAWLRAWRWLIPATGLAFSLLFLALTFQAPDAAVATGELIETDANDQGGIVLAMLER